MKINKKEKAIRNVNLRIDEAIMLRIDQLKTEYGISIRKIINHILKQTTGDKNFVLKIDE